MAYTSLLGLEPNSQQTIYQIVLCELASGQTRTLAPKAHLDYGVELNWSPDSQQIAYIDSGLHSKGEIVVISVRDAAARILSEGNTPRFNQSGRERPPLWDASGHFLYGIGNDGKLWKIEVASGHGLAIGDLAGHQITALVARAGKPTLWTTNGGHTAWVVARERIGTEAGIFHVDLESGQTESAIEDDRKYANPANLDANETNGEVVYVAEDQQHLADAWVLDTSSRQTHQVTHLNERLEHYELGAARVIEWYGIDGQKLRGALLLPPGYQKGRRLPLFVWVYGGRDGSRDVNNFGLWGDHPIFNFHVLATRGYAVLSPDTPFREGMPIRDLVSTVIPGVNAAIEQGYADPDRLAVGGQSYGSYCTLALISQTKRFKAAVITGTVIHPDLVADYLNSEPETPDSHAGYYEQEGQGPGNGNLHGTPWEQRDRYLANSPIYLFDPVETPLLIGQGSKDTYGHNLLPADATFAALTRLGKEVEYRIYEDEGHLLTRKPNVIDFWQRRLDFLAEHLNLTTDAKRAIAFDGNQVKSAKPN